jgi:hypothetical protein
VPLKKKAPPWPATRSLLALVTTWRRPDVEAALRAAESAGWAIEEVHHGHCWGVLRCPAGEHALAIWSTPADPGTLAKRVRDQVAKCQHEKEAAP